MNSDAFDLVVNHPHPSPENGGPCATCAFRKGTRPNETEHTTTLAMLCVEGLTPFHCHEHPQLCRGWIAAVNVLYLDGVPQDEDAVHHREACAFAAEALSEAIQVGVEADRLHAAAPQRQTAHEGNETT